MSKAAATLEAGPVTLGPVSQRLADELSGEVRRQGLVIWLDKDGSFTTFVDALATLSKSGVVDYPVVAFRKSFLEVLLILEGHGSGLDKEPMLIHMPGFNEETIRKTPILEMYEPGVRFRKALDTLIREAAVSRVAPHEVDSFLTESPTLEQADAWLRGAVEQSATGLEGLLEATGPTLVVQGLASKDSPLHARAQSPEEIAALASYLNKLVGLDQQWIQDFAPGGRTDRLNDLLDAFGAWLLCVEYVHDLKRPPHLKSLQRLKDLQKPLVKKASELLDQLRAQHGDTYVRMADEVESFLAAELRVMTAEDLGHIDTFREEENRVLAGAVAALQSGRWSAAHTYCEARHGERSFWLQRDQTRRWAWSLVAEAAGFGQTLSEHSSPLKGTRSVDEAVDRYANGAFIVDRAHRRFEQKRLTLLEPRLPHYGPLQEVVGSLRRLHRKWADDLAREFTRLCAENGFLPPASLRQRTFYEDVVHPLTFGGERVAVFMIDAFRYEMATELVEELKTTGSVVDLKARLAELPTITSVGMNVLAPVAQGEKLVVAGKFGGFKTGEFTVRTPETRARAMGTRSVGQPALVLKLVEVCEATSVSLMRRLGQHQLVVVHSKEIDDAGEANVGLPTFESTLRQIKSAWHHLQSAGIKHFVFTADHGFLLQDETTAIRPYGKKSDPSRRHVLDADPRKEEGMVPVSLSSLGYEGLDGYLLFREDTAVYDTGNPGANFVHGGNSPQERIIPVLTVTRKRAEGSSIAEYMIEAIPDTDVLGLHRVRVRLGFAKDTTTGLGFATAQAIDIGLRAVDCPQVRVVIKDVSHPAELHQGRVRLPMSNDWAEVFFGLEGPKDERARVEAHHPDNIERVRPVTLDAWFSVSGRGAGPVAPAEEPSTPMTWADAIENESVRQVFLHIEKHGAITEPEVTTFLGSPRAFRRFSLEFDNLVTKLPFRVRIETAEGGKRYVKEGNK